MKSKFTKADLKDGMVVELRDKTRVLFVNGLMLSKDDGHTMLCEYNDDLEFESDVRLSQYDVMKVFNVLFAESLKDVLNNHLELVWERKEVKHMTAEQMKAELEKLTGDLIEVEPSRNDMIATCYKFCEVRVDGCWGCRFEGSHHSCYFTKISNEELKECCEKIKESDDGREED